LIKAAFKNPIINTMIDKLFVKNKKTRKKNYEIIKKKNLKTSRKILKYIKKCKKCKEKNSKKNSCNINDYVLFSGAEKGEYNN